MCICVSVGDFVVCQRHYKLHSSCSNHFSDAGQGSRMILSATKGTSFHLTTCSRYCSLPSSLPSPALAPLPLSVGSRACSALPSYYLCPAMHSGGGMLLSHASHAHSLVWHAAPSDNTFSIRGPRQWHTIKQLFLSLPTPHTPSFGANRANVANNVGT